jgi:xylulokinase
VLGREIQQVADPVNANARGAGMLAAVALGELTFDDVPDRVTVTASHQPDPGTAGLYRMLYDEFVGFYKRNHKAHARLNAPRSV